MDGWNTIPGMMRDIDSNLTLMMNIASLDTTTKKDIRWTLELIDNFGHEDLRGCVGNIEEIINANAV